MKTSPELSILRGIAIVFVLASTTLANGADGTIRLDFKNQGLSANIENIPIKTVIKKITKKKKIWIKGAEKLTEEEYSVQFQNLSIPDALKRILSSFNYCLIFDRKGAISGIIIVSRQGGKYTPPAPKIVQTVVRHRRIRRKPR